MTLDEYKNQRESLMNEVDTLINSGDVETANAKMADVEKLDAEWENIRIATANANALRENAPAKDISDPGKKPEAEDKIDSMKEDPKMNIDPKEAYKTDEYKVAWAKTMMGQKLTADEAELYRMTNDALTTVNTGDVIPDTVAQGIWSEIEDMYPYFADITKTNVNGLFTIVKSTESSDAKWYDEDTETEDGSEVFATLTLSGCELARAITVSWKLKEMAMADFIPYITRRMAERMGAGCGYGVTNGAGPEAEKPEPIGIVPALKEEGNQVVTYSELAYTDITKARSLIKSGYATGLKAYANAATIWGVLANVVDNNNRPIFIPDQTAGGVYRILGMPVAEDASLADGDILISNAARGYQANINKQITVVTEDHAKTRTTDYVGYAILDGAPLTYKAHALLTGE